MPMKKPPFGASFLPLADPMQASQEARDVSIVEGAPTRRVFSSMISRFVPPPPPAAVQQPSAVAPIMQLSAVALVAPNASVAPNTNALRGPAGYGLLIDEIRFTMEVLYSDNNNDTQCFGAVAQGMLVAAHFTLGGKNLTAGFVPIALLGPARATQFAEYALIQSYFSADAGGAACYSWRPKDPIYVAPGAVLEPTFENRGLLNLKFRVRVSYTARPCGVPPAAQRLPYVVAWQTPVFVPTGTEVEVDSSEKDLFNGTDLPLRVECLVGRITSIDNRASTPAIYVQEGNTGLSNPLAYASVLNQTKLQLSASWGTRTVRDWIPWPAVFDMQTRSITCPHVLPPKAFYTAKVRGGSVAISNIQYFAAVSMVGSYEVKS